MVNISACQAEDRGFKSRRARCKKLFSPIQRLLRVTLAAVSFFLILTDFVVDEGLPHNSIKNRAF